LACQPRLFVLRIMKKFTALSCCIAFVLAWMLFNAHKNADTISQSLAEQKLKHFKRELNLFHQVMVGLTQNTVESKKVISAYKKLRLAYKQIEFLLEYTDPALIKENLNGAPLPRLDKTAPSLSVLQPIGFQVIDELMAELPDSAAAAELLVQTETLTKTMSIYQWQGKIYDRYIFEGAYLALIRLFSLGLTGFDTPGTLCGVDDAKAVMQSLNEFIELYEDAFNVKNKLMFNSLKEKSTKALSQLSKSSDFEKFDRFNFLVYHLNPLMQELVKAKHALQIETMEEVNKGKNALNFEANGLFDPNLLNVDFYLKLPEQYRNQMVVDLGKLLFYDPLLSANNSRSCASCHHPSKAFSDGLPKSKAFEQGNFIGRNSPGLINAVFAERYFHDLRAASLEDQTEHVIFSKDEFNTSYFQIFEKLNGSQTYLQRFQSAFPDFKENAINRTTLSYALAAYVGSLVSFNSPFDQTVRSGSEKPLSKEVIQGFNLFMGKAACGTCHFAPVFNGTTPPYFFESESEVLGVPADANANTWSLDKDLGRSEGRFKEKVNFYKHSFKTPTVRNISLTAPYMHNGSFNNLTSLMDFYNHGGGQGHGLEVPYQTLSSDSLGLNQQEITAIIRFMESLTDNSYPAEMPKELPKVEMMPHLNQRIIGGVY
jgi:cytochrome c peroxidase